jgi:hypothetical protein
MKTPKTQLKRAPKRGQYDFETIAQILDEGLVCHIGFVPCAGAFCVSSLHELSFCGAVWQGAGRARSAGKADRAKGFYRACDAGTMGCGAIAHTPIWAGVLPFAPAAGVPMADPQLPADIPIPNNVRHYSRTIPA